jgi:hypothetical protein
MQGFLNNDNKIRRLDNKSDIFEISDIIKKIITDFTSNNTRLINPPSFYYIGAVYGQIFNNLINVCGAATRFNKMNIKILSTQRFV